MFHLINNSFILENRHYIALTAFTIYELVVVMMLSSILIGIAFYAYSNLNQHLNNYNTYTNHSIEVLRLHTLLQFDANQSFDKQIRDNRWLFKHPNYVTTYHFYDDFITRGVTISDSPIDTFRVDLLTLNELLLEDEALKIPFIHTIQYLDGQADLIIPHERN